MRRLGWWGRPTLDVDAAARWPILERYLTPAGLDRVRSGTVAPSSFLDEHVGVHDGSWCSPNRYWTTCGRTRSSPSTRYPSSLSALTSTTGGTRWLAVRRGRCRRADRLPSHVGRELRPGRPIRRMVAGYVAMNADRESASQLHDNASPKPQPQPQATGHRSSTRPVHTDSVTAIENLVPATTAAERAAEAAAAQATSISRSLTAPSRHPSAEILLCATNGTDSTSG